MTPVGMAALILAVGIGVFLIWMINEPAVRAAVSTVEKVRFVVGFLFLIIAAYHFLQSGNPFLIGAAVVGFGFVFAYAAVERPWERTI